MAKAAKQEVQGEVYVWTGGTYYTKPTINADTIRDVIDNKYVFDAVQKLKSMIFTDKYTITVLNEKREPEEDVSKRLMSMAESVLLWSKMQMAWVDILHWGIAIFSPGWHWNGGEYILDELRRLPPESFSYAAPQGGNLYDDILKGVCMGKDGVVHYYQSSGIPGIPTREITSVFAIKDPTLPGLAGKSRLIPIIPLISMLNFSWKSQMQKVNRVGAPIIFIKITNAIGSADDPESDINYAQKVINNWGKDTAYSLRENMTLEELKVQDNETALRTIQELEKEVANYFNPSSMFKKEGSTIGGNAAAEKDLTDLYIMGQHSWLQDAFEPLFDAYLAANGYEGYEVEIRINDAATALGELERLQAETGYNTRVLSPNEERKKLGVEPITDDEFARIKEQWDLIAPPAPSVGFPMAQGEHDPTKEESEAARKIRKAQDEALDEILKGL